MTLSLHMKAILKPPLSPDNKVTTVNESFVHAGISVSDGSDARLHHWMKPYDNVELEAKIPSNFSDPEQIS